MVSCSVSLYLSRWSDEQRKRQAPTLENGTGVISEPVAKAFSSTNFLFQSGEGTNRFVFSLWENLRKKTVGRSAIASQTDRLACAPEPRNLFYNGGNYHFCAPPYCLLRRPGMLTETESNYYHVICINPNCPPDRSRHFVANERGMGVMFQRENCVWCNGHIEQKIGGREKAYCSVTCRVAACRAKKKIGDELWPKFLKLAPTRAGSPANWWSKLHENHNWWNWQPPVWPELLKERRGKSKA